MNQVVPISAPLPVLVNVAGERAKARRKPRYLAIKMLRQLPIKMTAIGLPCLPYTYHS